MVMGFTLFGMALAVMSAGIVACLGAGAGVVVTVYAAGGAAGVMSALLPGAPRRSAA